MSASITTDKVEGALEACPPEILELAIDVVCRLRDGKPVSPEDLDWLSAMAEIYLECDKLERLI